MIFTVTWKPSAKSQLTRIWLTAADKAAVTRAANQTDLLLKSDPENQGESRGENRRIMIIKPLAVAFRVHLLDRRVDVLSVRHLPTPTDKSGPE
jgi:plasmid stabilization system protein ParE